MTEVTVEEFEKDFDSYMDRIESGERFMIRQPDGRAVVAVPAEELDPSVSDMDDETWYNIFSEHNDAS